MKQEIRLLRLDSEAVLDRASAHSAQEPVVLYKHSTACGLSFRARREIHLLTEAGDPPVYEIVVQESRALSRAIAERLGVRHESPQVIVLHRGRSVYNASHGRVTAASVREAVQKISAP